LTKNPAVVVTYHMAWSNMRAAWEQVYDGMSGDVRRLSHVYRYSSIPTTVPENVMEHLGWVTLYSLMIHSQVGGPERLTGSVLLRSITHDLPEMVTGDVVRTFKYSSEALKKEISNAEDVMMKRVHPGLQHAYSMGSKFDSVEDEEYVESIVKAADFAALQQHLSRELQMGNRLMYPFIERMAKDLHSKRVEVESNPNELIKRLSGFYGVLISRSLESRVSEGYTV
jgi:5'-deoxynucleotidase YfbR-like HD superfamily hydrolase